MFAACRSVLIRDVCRPAKSDEITLLWLESDEPSCLEYQSPVNA